MFFDFETKKLRKKIIMNRVISDKIKTSIIEQVFFGDDVRDVAEKYQVSRTSMHKWTNDERMMIACCNDGTRPVIFKIERIDIPGKQDYDLYCIPACFHHPPCGQDHRTG